MDYRGSAYRQCHPDHTDLAATVRASLSHPFRFNPPGEFGVLYVALSPATARAELERQAQRLGIRVSRLAPRVMLTLAVRLQRVLDLTDARVREEHRISADQLRSDDYSACQRLARDARLAGYDAILYSSATGAGANLAIFLDALNPDSIVEVSEIEILPLVDA